MLLNSMIVTRRMDLGERSPNGSTFSDVPLEWNDVSVQLLYSRTSPFSFTNLIWKGTGSPLASVRSMISHSLLCLISFCILTLLMQKSWIYPSSERTKKSPRIFGGFTLIKKTSETKCYIVSVLARSSSAIFVKACFTFSNCFCDMVFEPAA